MGFFNFLQGVGRQLNPLDNGETFKNPSGNGQQASSATQAKNIGFGFLKGAATPFLQLPKDIALAGDKAILTGVNKVAGTNYSIQAPTSGPLAATGSVKAIAGNTAQIGLDFLAPEAAGAASDLATGAIGAAAPDFAARTISDIAGAATRGGVATPALDTATKLIAGPVAGAALGGPFNVANAAANNQPLNASTIPHLLTTGAAGGAAFGLGAEGLNLAAGAIGDRTPLNQVGSLNNLEPGDITSLAKAKTEADVKQVLKDKVDPAVASEVAPSIALSNNPSTIQQIISKAESPAPPSVTPDLTATPVSDVANPAGQGSLPTPVTPDTASVSPELSSATRPRGFIRTVKNSETSTPELQKAAAEVKPQDYIVKPNQPMVDRAKSFVDTNYDQALKNVTESQHLSDEDITVGQILQQKAQAEGRTSDAIAIAAKLDQSLREHGRAVQAASIWGRLTPEGMLRYAVGLVKKAKAPDLSPEAGKVITDNMEVLRNLPGGTVGSEAQNIEKALTQPHQPSLGSVKQAVRETIDNNQQALPLEGVQTRSGAVENTGTAVAKNVERAAAPPQIKQKADALVAEITKKVKQEMLEPKPGTTPVSAIDTLKEVFGRNQEAQDAFPYAQDILRQKYANSPQMTEALDKFFGSKLGNPAASSTINRAIVEQLTKNEDKVSQIITKSWKGQQTSVEAVAKNLTDNGFDKQSAQTIAKEVTDRLNQQISDAKSKALVGLAKESPPSAHPTIIDKVNKLSNLGALDKSDYLELARAKLGTPNLSPEAAQRLSELSQQIQDNPNAANGLVKEVHDTIAKAIPSSGGDKAFALWRTGLLTGPQTFAKVAVSHGVQAAFSVAKDYPSAIIDKIVSAVTGNRSVVAPGLRELDQYRKGFGVGFGDAKQYMKDGLQTDPLTGNSLEFQNSVTFQHQVFQNYSDWIGRAHAAIPKSFSTGEAFRSMFNQATAAAKNEGLKGEEAQNFISNFVKDPPKVAADQAIHEGQLASLQQETSLGKVASAIQQKGGVIGKVVAPFTRVPSAIATDLINYSPIGAVRSVIDGIKAARSDEGFTLADQRKFSQGLGQSITGSAAIVPGIMLYNKGIMTLGYPTDPKEQKLWAEQGKIPNAVKIGGQWRSLGSLGPVGSVLSIGAHMADSLFQGKSLTQAVTDGFVGGAQSIEEQSYLRGVSGAINAVNDPGRYAGNFAKQTAGSIVPTGVATLAAATDPNQRAADTPLDTIKSRIPGARETLPVKTDALGNPLKAPETGIEKIIDPFQSSSATKPTPLTTELTRLQNAGQGIQPATVAKKNTFDGVKTDLNPTQVRELTANIGNVTKDIWTKIIQDPSYASLPDDQKQQILSSLYSAIASQEKSKFAQKYKLGVYSPSYQADRIKTLTGRQYAYQQ